jgi:type VII secretion-associated serine protease mycosin
MTVRRIAAVLAATAVAGLVPGSTALAAVDPAPGATCAGPGQETRPDLPWAQRRLGFIRAWELSRGAGVTVAVVDSGVDARTPQLAGRVDAGIDVLDGHGPADTDCIGHGTAVAAIIAAAPLAGSGFVGVAPAARILPIRQTDAGHEGSASGLADGIRAAVDRGARVVNVSVTTSAPSRRLQQAVEYAAAKDVLIVAAAANDAQTGNPRTYPAAYPGVLGVAAVGQDDRRADFSETGDFIGVAAPGVDVVTVGPGGPGEVLVRGTSYAAPFVAGVAALIRSRHPTLTATQVRRRIEQTAVHPAVALPDPNVGWGVVDPYAAVAAALPADPPAAGPAAAPLMPAPVAAPPADTRTARWALRGAGGLAAAGALVLAAAAVARRGRRRRWQAGRPPRPSTVDDMELV